MKFELAQEIVARFHDGAAEQRAVEDFMARFRDKSVPTDLPRRPFSVDPAGIRIANLLKEGGLAASTSEANRKIEEGAVKIDGERVSDRGMTLFAGRRTRGPDRLATHRAPASGAAPKGLKNLRRGCLGPSPARALH